MQMPIIFLYLHLRDIFLVQFQSPLWTWINPSSFFCLQCSFLFIHCLLSVVGCAVWFAALQLICCQKDFWISFLFLTMVSVIYVFWGAADLSLNYSGLMWIKLSGNLGLCSGFVSLVLQGWEEGREPSFSSMGSPPKSVGLVLGCKLWKSMKRHPLYTHPNIHILMHISPWIVLTLFLLAILITYLWEPLVPSVPHFLQFCSSA